jgi:phosphoribosylamine--glycine ligase
MLTAGGPKMLEFNCRMGDPEAQPMVARTDFDLAEALVATAVGSLGRINSRWKQGASVCVVMASGGYPGDFETGKRVEGLAEASAVPGVVVFHAGTRQEGANYYTSGGRVLGVTAAASDLEAAIRTCYDAVGRIRFEGAHFRSDIAAAGLTKTRAAGD